MSVIAMPKFLETAARLDRLGVAATRHGLVVVLICIGGLKAYPYEAEAIVPLVSNSPLMSFFYRQPAGEYRRHLNREGELVPADREWHLRNGTYRFAYGLGSVIVALDVMIALHPWLPRVSAVGSFLAAWMSLVTLSFLITTPECWVPTPGSPGYGFPRLSGAGRLVVKDAIMMGAAIVTMADPAKAAIREMELPCLTGRSSDPPPDPTVGEGIISMLSWTYPRDPIDLGDRVSPLPEGGSVPGLDGWRRIFTPGQTPGHVTLSRDADGTLIAGDVFVTTKRESALTVMTYAPRDPRAAHVLPPATTSRSEAARCGPTSTSCRVASTAGPFPITGGTWIDR